MEFFPAIIISLAPYILSMTLLIILLEQISYLKKKRSAPGPNLVLPFIGNAISLLRNTTEFWDRQSTMAKSSDAGFSVNYLFGKFIVFIRSTDLSRKVFTNVRQDAFRVIAHVFGKKLLAEDNIVYMLGDVHKDLRRRIAPIFSPKALSTYVDLQQRIILKHLRSLTELPEFDTISFPLRQLCRDLNLETSQSVFIGRYLSDESRKRFNVDYNVFNLGFVSSPIDLPGFAFREARLALSRLIGMIADCVDESKTSMKSGEEATSLVDFWMLDVVREIAEAEESGGKQQPPPPPHTTSTEIGSHIFDFLFAAQDASTSSLLWAVALLDLHPEVVERVRKEVSGVWSPESDKLITYDQLREMRYTEAVAKEVVRYRAPATMVPHVAVEDFELTDTYTIPKGAIVFPSAFESSFQGFVDADRFDPDRFMEDRQEDRVFKKNYLAFGAGPHQCVGQRYAINHLVLFIAMFTSLFNFKRDRSDGCDEMVYVPTICPRDGCKVVLSLRGRQFHCHS